MAKSIPKIGSRKTGRIGSRKHPRKIPKGVIYIQASFNNTIVTVTDVRGSGDFLVLRRFMWIQGYTKGGHHLPLKPQREMLFKQ
ncbi:unnamed protein product [Lathyrus oleraceus]